MSSPRRALSILIAIVLALLVRASAQATSNRVFISISGNDANDCSNPLTPCLDFAGALSQVNAGGEIIAEATGPYGPLNITKSVTISGPPGLVVYSGHQVTVNAPFATVVLRGLTIDGTGAGENGINVVAVGALHVENCVITGFSASGPAPSGHGLYFGSSGHLFVKDTIIRGNNQSGIWINPSGGLAFVSIDHCRLEANSNYGLVSEHIAETTIRDSVVSGNALVGLQAAGDLNIENCLVTNNGTGIASVGVIRVSNSTVTENTTGLSYGIGVGQLLSRSNNTVEGNGTDGTFSGTYSAK